MINSLEARAVPPLSVCRSLRGHNQSESRRPRDKETNVSPLSGVTSKKLEKKIMSISIIRVCLAFSAAATGFMSDVMYVQIVQLQMCYPQMYTILN